MSLVVVAQEKNVKELTARLLRADASKAVTERAVKALRAANPTLDLDRLTPGAVVVVPALEEGRARGERDDLARGGISEVVEALADQITALSAQAAQAEDDDALLRKQAAEVLSDPAIERASHHEALKALVGSLGADLDAEEEAAKARQEVMAAAAKDWASDLAALRRLT
jgi:hypothetical protein